jgi:autotransporter-associated beta strand protein
MKSFFLTVFIAASSLFTMRGATSYYVATNGWDGNPGTLSAPFQTIAHGASVLTAGNTLYIRGGVYRETIQPSVSGTASAPILITAYSNETVTVSGADVVSDWGVYSNSIYSASTSWNLGPGRNQVFLDGQMEQEARFPNFGNGDLLHPVFSTVTIGTPTNVVTCNDYTNFPAHSLVGAYFVGGIGSSWAFQAAPITNSSGNSITLDTSHVDSQWFTGSGPGFLFGLLSLLNADNEWYMNTNTSTLYLQITGGGNPNTHLVELKHRLWTVNLTNVNYVAVNGLNLVAGAVQMAAGHGLAVTGCRGEYLSHFLTFTNGTIAGGPYIWDHGVHFTSTNSTLGGCTLYNTAGSAVFLAGLSNSITRNCLYNIDYAGVNGAAVDMDGNSNTITFNTISNLGWAGFAPINDSESGHSIFYNDVSAIEQLAVDTGVFYSASGSNPHGMRVAYNWFHDLYSWRHSGVFLYLDGASTNMNLDHNVCWNEAGRASVQIAAQAGNDRFYNNTFFNVPPYGNGSTNAYFTNNLYLSYVPQTQLTDWLDRNFRLLPGSSSIDAGIVVPGITDGYLGSAPDLGAYEFGGPYWVPGVTGWNPSQPGVYTEPPLTWNGTSATLQGLLESAGTAPTTVMVYWGSSDGGTNFANWPNNLNLGVYSTNPVSFTPQITGLTAGSQFAYRFYATNANGQYWGLAQCFTNTGGIWDADASAAWSDTGDWQGGIIPDGIGAMADFSTIGLAADRIVSLDTPRTVGALRFADTNTNYNWTISGGNALTLSTLPNSHPSVEVVNQSATISAPVIGSEGLCKLGAGTLLLTAQNSYSGNTVVLAGSLLVNGSISNSPVTLAQGGTLGGNGTIVSAVTGNAGSVISPGSQGFNSAGTMIVTNLTLNGAQLLFDLSAVTTPGRGVNDLIDIHGGVLNINLPVTLVPNLLDGLITNGTYLVISNAASIVGNVPTLFSASVLSASFFTNSGAGPYNVYMTVSNAAGAALTWTGTAGNVWDVNTTTNWLNTLSQVPCTFGSLDRVSFDNTGAGSTVALTGALTPASVCFDNSTAHPYTVQGSGKISGATSFAKFGFGTVTLDTADNNYTGPTLVAAGTLVLDAPDVLPTSTILDIGAGDTNNPSTGSIDLSSASQTVDGLNIADIDPSTLVNTSAALVDDTKITNQIIIGAGQNLTVNGNVDIANNTITTGFAEESITAESEFTCLTIMRGAGTFNVQTNGGLFQFNGNLGTTVLATAAHMDMSGLANASINLGSGGTMNVGDLSQAGDGNNSSVLTLASNTVVTANIIDIGNSARNQPQTLKLGGGSNVFNINTLQLGVTRDWGQMFFNNTNGSIEMRAANGLGAATVTVGPNSGTTYAASNQFLDLRGHYADLLVSTLKVGEDDRGSSGAPYSSNYFGFSSGLLNVTALRVGNRLGNPSSTPALWYNTCDLDGGVVTVGATGIVMGTGYGTEGATSTNAATLNINGGTVTVAGNIVLATQNAATGNNAVVSALNLAGGTLTVSGNILCDAGAASPASRLSSLNLNGTGAVLDLTGHAIGGPGNTVSNTVNFVDALNFQAGTVQNVGQINGGEPLVKNGAGTLSVAGTNVYTGGTIVSNGTLNVVGMIGGSGPVTVLAGAELTGHGVIQGPVTVSGILAPGVLPAGVLGMNSTLTLNAGSTTTMELYPALGTNNSVSGLASVTYGGVLVVIDVNGTLAGGETFVLFHAATHTGAFGSITLPSLASGLVWTNNLAVNGSIGVIALPQTRPQISGVGVSGTNLVLSITGGTPNSDYQVMTSTNLSVPISLWTSVVAGILNSNGRFTNQIPINPSAPENFYLLMQ